MCFSGPFFVGQCIPAEVCPFFSCEQISNVLPSNLPFEIESCSSACCSDNLCNSPGKSFIFLTRPNRYLSLNETD